MNFGTTPELTDLTVTIDHAETVPNEQWWAHRRGRFSINPLETSDVIQLQSGAWILKPINSNFFNLHRTTEGNATIVPASAWRLPAPSVEFKFWRQNTEWGLAADAAASDSGDDFILERLPAPVVPNLEIPFSLPKPTEKFTPIYPIDRIQEFQNEGTRGIDPVDQGYMVRWMVPGHPLQFPDCIFRFYFGGKLTDDGYGLFVITLTGDGKAFLRERISDAWELVDEWHFATAEQVPGAAHTLRIIPHLGKYIEFRSGINERVVPSKETTNKNAVLYGRQIDSNSHTYVATNRGTLPDPLAAEVRGITGPGQPKMDRPRDMRLARQVSRVMYPASGTLTDTAFKVPNELGILHALEIRQFGVNYLNPDTKVPITSIVQQAINAEDDVNLTSQNESYTFNGETINVVGWRLDIGNPGLVKMKFTFNNLVGRGEPQPISPVLVGYEAQRRGNTVLTTPTPIVINDTHPRMSPVENINISGADQDPSHGTMRMTINDLVDRASVLRVRSDIPVRVSVKYETGPDKSTVLFEGYAKPVAKLKGNVDYAYPDPAYHRYDVLCTSKWQRLKERAFLFDIIQFASSREDPNKPWKITDAIRHLLILLGFPETQIDIPESPMRFWPTGDPNDASVFQFWKGANLADFIVRIARDYLNAYFIWDPAAGALGMWRLKFVPKGTETAVWTFVLTGAASGKLAHLPASYGAGTSYVIRGTHEAWTVAPEGNFLRVIGQDKASGNNIICEVRNPDSYNVPGGATADVNSPDYLGRIRPLYVKLNPALTSAEAVHLATRLIYERACRAQQYVRFETPLVLFDPSEPSIYTTYEKRPLMFGDVVSFDGSKYMVTSNNILGEKQHHLTQRTELRKFPAVQPFS